MIASWPDPFPDELLYSVIARSGTERRVRYYRTLARQLLGTRHARAKIDLPYRLHHLSTKIPGKYGRQPERIAHELTLLPLHLPFVRSELGQKLTATMIGLDGESRRIPHLKANRSGCPKFLRFCPHCWKEQKKERYWSRSHQAAGYLVCHVHRKPMWESPVSSIFQPSLQQFVDASTININKCRPTGVKVAPVLVSLAQSLHWLLNQNSFYPGVKTLQAAYFDALRENGLTKGSFVREKIVRSMMIESSSARVLAALDSGLRHGEADWVTLMLRISRLHCSSQPAFRHLLLMNALGHSAATFFAAMQRPTLLEATLGTDVRTAKVKSKRERAGCIQKWWGDATISVNEMARRLAIDCDSVTLLASKLGLPFPRLGRWGNKMDVDGQGLTDIRERHRKRFIELRRNAPEAGLKALAAVDSRVVSWLRCHDWAWLQQNRPAPQRRGGAPCLDWMARDKASSERIPSIVSQLKSEKMKVSVSAIERRLGVRIGNMRKMLPQTDLLLHEVCETGLGRLKI